MNAKESELLTIKQASEWATAYLHKNVTPSNISYLIQYGRIEKVNGNGMTCVKKQDLIEYYANYLGTRENVWKNQLGSDLNWALSFENIKEAETTKHVHRLHPYKGKFIPQLVEYFLNDKTDDFKKTVYFQKNDIILDPFCGSGTLLVQANELGMHAIGIDISAFNALISNVKVGIYHFARLQHEIAKITHALQKFVVGSNSYQFERELTEKLNQFNNLYFPVPEFKYKVRRKEIDDKVYGAEKEKEFLTTYFSLVKDFDIQFTQNNPNNFLDKWYLQSVRHEIDFVFELIKQIQDVNIKKVLSIILSRTIRSCRATTHADLATLKNPVTTTYYCAKHGKMCKPLFSMLNWWERYSKDTFNRLKKFDSLRTNSSQICLAGDSKTIDIFDVLERKNPFFAQFARKQKIKGIFSSPPYVGLINYHEQHAYAYDLLGFNRHDELEIGPLFKGKGKEARNSYVQGVSEVLNNCKQFLADDYHVFLVANDKHNLYQTIAKKAGMKIIDEFKRPVLNRTEKDKSAYSETIFHLRAL